MITLKLAKSVMENEEGMNHLWIQFDRLPSENITNVEISLCLPLGIHRLRNLNGYCENESGVIQINDPVYSRDVVIEIYTKVPVNYKKAEIFVDVSYRDDLNTVQMDTHSISLMLLREDEMNEMIIDDEVVHRVKGMCDPLSNRDARTNADEWEFVIIPPKIVTDSNEFSEFEKKYRVDYGIPPI